MGGFLGGRAVGIRPEVFAAPRRCSRMRRAWLGLGLANPNPNPNPNPDPNPNPNPSPNPHPHPHPNPNRAQPPPVESTEPPKEGVWAVLAWFQPKPKPDPPTLEAVFRANKDEPVRAQG